jgi:hypothetical protein
VIIELTNECRRFDLLRLEFDSNLKPLQADPNALYTRAE